VRLTCSYISAVENIFMLIHILLLTKNGRLETTPSFYRCSRLLHILRYGSRLGIENTGRTRPCLVVFRIFRGVTLLACRVFPGGVRFIRGPFLRAILLSAYGVERGRIYLSGNEGMLHGHLWCPPLVLV
jgi:hypothetical protein